MTFDVDDVLAKLSNKEKIALLSGHDFWHTYPIPEHNVPSIRVSDGPNGIRGTKFFAGVPATCIPCATSLASTWDKNLLHAAGNLIGHEAIAKGAAVWLGPTINMQRSALGGRGFESFSEDPHLSGRLAAEMIKGCEKTGVQACVKHFVCNDQEHERRAVDVRVMDRGLREIYLRPFQIVARDAKPGALMTSYNKLNGIHVSESTDLIQGLIRGEWNWDPLVMSDWYGTYTTARALNAGLDLEMPGTTRYRGTHVEFALSARLITPTVLNSRVRKVLEFVNHASKLTSKFPKEESSYDSPETRALNRKLAADGCVLLKNDLGVLPLPKNGVKKIALIGSHIKTPAISGGGSAALEPVYTVSLYEAITEKLSGTNIQIIYEPGAYAHKMLPVVERLLKNGKMNFYNEMVEVKGRRWLGSEPLHSLQWQLMDYNECPGLNKLLFYASIEGDFIPDATGIWDFGVTVFGTANLYIDGELIIDNTSVQHKGTAFFGKGTVEEFGSKALVEGRTYKLRIEFGSSNTSRTKDVGTVSFGGGACHIGAALRLDPETMIQHAVKAAEEADFVIVCTGINADWESEGFDRPHPRIPPAPHALLHTLLSPSLPSSAKTILVTQSGTPITIPHAATAPTILHAWYGGNDTGSGIVDVLFGDVNPAGKLPISWVSEKSEKESPAWWNWGSVGGRCLYGEDWGVGYRWWDRKNEGVEKDEEKGVQWAFGHGLSYTTFELSDLEIGKGELSSKVTTPPSPPTVTVTIQNTGKVAGAEVLQLYVTAPSPLPNHTLQEGHVRMEHRPVKELHGFEKVFLQPGEQKRVRVKIDAYAGSYWDEIEDGWKLETGVYGIVVGGNGGNLEVAEASKVNGKGNETVIGKANGVNGKINGKTKGMTGTYPNGHANGNGHTHSNGVSNGMARRGKAVTKALRGEWVVEQERLWRGL